MIRSWLEKAYHQLPLIRELHAIKTELEGLSRSRRLLETSAIIQTMEVLRASDERFRNPQRLLVHGAQYWSQNYEDGMIAEIFRRIGTTSKTFLEVGVGDGSQNNTTALLSAGWSGWWIEGDSNCCVAIKKRLQRMPEVAQRLNLNQVLVFPENINALLAELKVPKEIDLFSLDIDLNTYHIWAELTEFQPRVVVVEYNGAFPTDQVWIHPLDKNKAWDYSQAFGASLKAFELLGTKLGYSLVGCDLTGINAFFVRNDLLGDHFVGPFTSENHHEPPRYYLSNRAAHSAKFAV